MLRAGARIPPGIVGSSPLTRGKRVRSLDNLGQVGLIPAHAGKTRPVAGASGWVEAHPRSRGENTALTWADISGLGSSPLTRGKLGPGGTEPQRVRLIPAHAGKTSKQGQGPHKAPAHPRSRGENPVFLAFDSPRLGSSPLTRGKLEGDGVHHWFYRLIPAHAGKTPTLNTQHTSTSAHPRSRGENVLGSTGGRVYAGSSPLTRGKPRGRNETVCRLGLIPAHAGKTNLSALRGRSLAAHPRSRGENSDMMRPAPPIFGSSPLTRGKL